MGFRQQMAQMRREYRKEVERLDLKMDGLAGKTDMRFQELHGYFQKSQSDIQEVRTDFQEVRTDFQRVQDHLRRADLGLSAVQDQFGACIDSVAQLREDFREVGRTLQGRARLLEGRFGKMLDLVETTMGEPASMADLQELEQRVRALEEERDSAA